MRNLLKSIISRLSKAPPWLKIILQKMYWWGYDLRDYLAEVVGLIYSNRLRILLWRILGVKIGKYVSVHRYCRFYAPIRVNIQDNVVILRNTLLDGRSGIEIGKNVNISEDVMIITLQHDIQSTDWAGSGGPVKIKDYVFIGARAVILPGVIVNKGAVVAAGAVVTKDVEPYTIVGGVPADKIGMRTQDLNYTLKYRKLLG